MTRYLSIMTIGAALSMTAGMAAAGDTVSADTILNALKPKAGREPRPFDRPAAAGGRRRAGQGSDLRQHAA